MRKREREAAQSKGLVRDTFIWREEEKIATPVRRFPGFAHSTLWLQRYKNYSV